MRYYTVTPKIDFMPIVIRREDGLWIPMDERNADYNKYLQWLEEGNTPEEYNPDNIDNGTE